jgi:hypothetical protein
VTGSTYDPIDAALARALFAAVDAGRLDLVATLAEELRARRLAAAGNVVALPSPPPARKTRTSADVTWRAATGRVAGHAYLRVPNLNPEGVLMRVFVCLLFVGVGCSSASAKPVNGPDGEPGWYMIKCEDDRANCIEKAGEACPRGYDIADDQKSVGAYAMPIGNAVFAGESSSYRILVKCHTS